MVNGQFFFWKSIPGKTCFSERWGIGSRGAMPQSVSHDGWFLILTHWENRVHFSHSGKKNVSVFDGLCIPQIETWNSYCKTKKPNSVISCKLLLSSHNPWHGDQYPHKIDKPLWSGFISVLPWVYWIPLIPRRTITLRVWVTLVYEEGNTPTREVGTTHSSLR